MSQTVFPIFTYRDAAAAIAFLEQAFGFERRAVHTGDDGTVQHAELAFRGGLVMLGSARDEPGFEPGVGRAYLVTDEPDALHDRAKAAGAQIAMELRDTDYGSRDFSAVDPEGNLWSFGTYGPSS
jgi:uncharacterized glyoxalase superfamily protein PhnB